ncbi:hypothetical protein BH11PSE14_BH11PSE14_18900 [soil metagenome]
MNRRTPLVLATLLLAAASALALAATTPRIEQQLTPEQMHATGLDTLTSAQLDLLNTLLQAKAEAAERARAAEPGRLAEAGRAAGAGSSLNPASYIGLADQPIKSRLVGSVSGWEPGTEFHLANGQVWKVLKGNMTLRKPMQAPEIIVMPGIAGRWFLQVDEDLPKARVYRTD